MYKADVKGRAWWVVGLALLAISAFTTTALAQFTPTDFTPNPTHSITSVTLQCSEREKAFVLGFLTVTGAGKSFGQTSPQTESHKVESSDFALRCLPGKIDTFTFATPKKANDAFIFYISEQPNIGNTARPQLCILGVKDGKTAMDLNGDNDAKDTIYGILESSSGAPNIQFNENFTPGVSYGLPTPSTSGTTEADNNPTTCRISLPAGQGQTKLTFNPEAAQVTRPFITFDTFSQTLTHNKRGVVLIKKAAFSGDISFLGIRQIQSFLPGADTGSGVLPDLAADVGPNDVTSVGAPKDVGGPPNRFSAQIRDAVGGVCKGPDDTSSGGALTATNPSSHSGYGALIDPKNPGNGPWCLYKIPVTDTGSDALYSIVVEVQGPGGTTQLSHFVTVKHTSTAGLEALSVKGVQAMSNVLSAQQPMTLFVEGSGIASVEVELFDLTGRQVAKYEAQGQALSFYAMDKLGRTLANGVYLYTVKVKGYDGKVIRTEIRKLIVKR